MMCRQCQRENRADSRFCLGCGATLSLVCSCGRDLPVDAAFCDACGSAVPASREGAAPPTAADPLPRPAPAPASPSESSAELLSATARALERFEVDGDVNAEFAEVRKAVARADQSGQARLRVATRRDALPIAQAADPDLALCYADEALELLDELGDASELASAVPLEATFLWHRVLALVESGRLEEALDASGRLAALAGQDPSAASVQLAVGAAAHCHCLAGDYTRAAESLRAPLELDAGPASTAVVLDLRLTLGTALLGAGELKQSAQCLEDALDSLHGGASAKYMEPALRSALSLAVAELGETGRAVELAREALALSLERGMQAIEAQLRINLGFTLVADLGADSKQAVESELERLSELEDAGHFGAVDACRAIALRATLATALGEDEAASVLLRTLRARYRSIGATGRVARLAAIA